MRKIVVDVRMLEHSGIGTYIRNLVPRLGRRLDDLAFHLLGDTNLMRGLGWDRLPNVEMAECPARVYSVREQLEVAFKTPRDARLFWAPHFNFPVLLGGKALVTVHDVFHLAMPRFVKGFHRRVYARAIFKALRAKAERVICVSRFTSEELVRLTGLDPGRIVVIHNGVDESWSHVNAGDSPHPKPYLVYVGNVKPSKNLKGLFDAFALLLERIPHDLVIIGQTEGFLSADRESIARAPTLTDRIIFKGRLPDEDVRRFVANAEALVHPSLYEGFGLTPLEAMACGVPAVASRAASIPEACGDAALYFDPYDPRDMADSILRVLEDSGLRDDLRARGKAQVARYSWDRTCEKTAEVIRELAR